MRLLPIWPLVSLRHFEQTLWSCGSRKNTEMLTSQTWMFTGIPQLRLFPHYKAAEMEEEMAEAFGIKELFESMPVAPWIGSNSWVIGPSKTKNGKVLFSNDTHIAYAQPSVWYEAHIEFPGLKSYGSYLAGVPFPVIGHNEHHAIGLTMFENDDIDFYVEKINPENANQVYVNDHWEEMESREERGESSG